MLDLNTFIPNEITLAPAHPLALQLDRPLADGRLGSQSKIWQLQQCDRIPGIVKRMIPLNATTAWEYWWCVPGRMLLPEDVELLRRDRARVETILGKLVWLLGGNCFGENSSFHDDVESIYDWQQVLEFVQNTGLNPDVLDIDFMPTAIEQVRLSDPYEPLPVKLTTSGKTSNYVAVEPGHWHIEFFHLQPIEGGFVLQEPKPMCSCQIWTGKPFIKNLNTGEIVTRYDLGISMPIDITSHPWLNSPQVN